MSDPTCYRHPDRTTGRACTRCGRPACSDCLQQASVGSLCPECRKESRPAAVQRLRWWNAAHPTVATAAIVAVNVAVFIYTSVHRNADIDLGLYGPYVADGDKYRLITSGFVHANVIHIGFNMLFIWRFGQILENALGRVRFLSLYFASMLAGSAGALIATPHSLTVGASGAAFGLLGAVIVGLRHRGVGLFQTDLGGLLVINLMFTFFFPGISIGGHIGGLIGGGLVGAVLLRPVSGKRPPIELLAPLAVAVVSVLLALAAAGRA